MAATFRRNLTITHPVLGGRFKDAPVSPVYTDVFDSNMTVFGDTGFDVGRIPLGSSINAVDYLLEFPVLETPKFGAGDLSGLELNLYFSI